MKDLNTSGLEGDAKKNAELMKFFSDGFDKLGKGMTSILKTSLDVTSSIYKELKEYSPLLQAVESLFNLAMQLFFMPLGNKLAEVLIPSVITLVEDMTKMWDELGDGNLSEIFGIALDKGITHLATFFDNIGDSLDGQGSTLSAIATLFHAISNLLNNNFIKLVETIIKWSAWNIEHIGALVTLIGTFMTLHYALQLATMAVIAASSDSISGKIAGGLALAAGVTAVAGIAGSAYIGGVVSGAAAEGAKVPATPGGQLWLVGEGGEDEYIIPESKMGSMGGNVTYNITVNGYTDTDLTDKITSAVNELSTQNRLRSGF